MLQCTTSAFAPACEPLRALRSYEAQHQAKIVTLNEIPAAVAGSPTFWEIMDYFKNTLYPAPTAGYGTEYILLVGDSEYIPAYGKYDAYSGSSDSSYTNFFSNGPEIAIGRICVHNSTEIQNYYQKIAPAGNSGVIIPDGKDKTLIYGGGLFIPINTFKNLWNPYLATDEFNYGTPIDELLNRINTHSIQLNTTHGYGDGLENTLNVLNTQLKPFYLAEGCSSAAFWVEPPLFKEHVSEYYINQPGTYSTIIGAVKEHFDTFFSPEFFKGYFVYGYERIGDMMKWAQNQPGISASLMTLLGDPYLKIASNQFLNMPRIYIDSQKEYSRFYNLDMGTGSIDQVTFSIYSFNNCQWSINNIIYSDPAISAHISFSTQNGSGNATIKINFLNPDTLSAKDYTLNFDIIDVSNTNKLIKQVKLTLSIANNNILSESDFIINGNEKRLPKGNYILQNDLIIETGKTLVIPPGTTIKGDAAVTKIIIQSGAKIKAIGTITEPILFMPLFPDFGQAVSFEIQSDGTESYNGEFVYCLFGEKITGLNSPRLNFDNCTFNCAGFGFGPDNSLFPSLVKGKMKNSVIARGEVSWPAKAGNLSSIEISYSLVPRDYKQYGKGILWDYEDFAYAAPRPNSTSLCINAGDPNDPLDPDGTRKDIGVFYFPLSSAINVPRDYSTIQDALNAAQSAEIKAVIVSPGIYQENLIIPSGIRLMGAQETNRPEIQGMYSADNLIQIGPWGQKYLIENFVIYKHGSNKTGRAISIDNANLCMLRNIEFANNFNNEALIYSIGNTTLYMDKVNFKYNMGNKELVHFEKGSGYLQDWIKDCSFEFNSANERLIYFTADNIGFSAADLLIYKIKFVNNGQECLLLNNTSALLPPDASANLTLERCFLYDNFDASSIQNNFNAATAIVSSVFSNNGAMSPFNVIINDSAKLNINNSILWNNTITFNKAPTAALEINYSDTNSAIPVTGTENINIDPMFLDIMAGDFQLQLGSPCIDTGDPLLTASVNGGSQIDMGAFEKLQDATPPTTPVVNDEGGSTENTDSLSASWNSYDLDTGVTEYQYQIRENSPVSGAVIKDWTSTQSNIVSALGLNLLSGQTYYFGVKSKNEAGVWSDIGYSDGILVNQPNQTPVLTPIGNKAVDENVNLSFTVSATDADGDTLTYSTSVLPSGAAFNAETKTFNWTPAFSQTGNYSITFTVSDGNGGTDSEAIIISVGAVNRLPVLTPIGNKTVEENALLSFTISATDPDGDTLSYSGTTLPLGAILDPNSGAFSWTPSYIQAGNYPVTFTVTDTEGASVTESITITVNNVNRLPVLTPIGNKAIDENALLGFTISATDADSDTLVYSTSLLPSGAAFNAETKTFSWTPTYTQAGSYNVTFTVSDINGGTDSEAIAITVNNVNRPPSITAGPTAAPNIIYEIQTSQLTVTASDPDSDTLTYTWNPSAGSIGGSGNSVVFSPPAISQPTTVTISLTINDGNGGSAAKNVSLTVNALSSKDQTPWKSNESGQLYTNSALNNTTGYHFMPNKDGVITKLGGFFNGAKKVSLWNKSTGKLLAQTTVTSSNAWSYVDITPVEVTKDQTYTVAVYLGGSGGSFRSSNTALFPKRCGNIEIKSSTSVSGNTRPTGISNVTVMWGQVDINFVAVEGVNYTPKITSYPTKIAYINQQYQYAVEAFDPDEDALTFTLTQSPTGMTIASTTGIISWIPTSSQIGTYDVALRVTDTKSPYVKQSYSVTVLAASAPFVQTPWKTNENGTLYNSLSTDDTRGYHFKPTKNGKITKLGGYFSGTKIVSLWNKSTGALLAQAKITSANNWSYVDINPVSVSANSNYTVAVYSGGGNISYRSSIQTLPRAYADITINSSTYVSGNARPTNSSFTTSMYGQVDINFAPN